MLRKFAFFLMMIVMTGGRLMAAEYELLTDLGSSAETISLGNVEGFNRSAAGIFENPAGMYRIENASIGLFMTTLMDEVYYKNVSIASRLPVGVVGFGYSEASVFDIPLTAENSVTREFYVQDTFDYRDSMMKLGYVLEIDPGLAIGGSYVHYSRKFYDISATGANFDLGILYEQPRYSVSLFARNIIPGTQVNFSFADRTTASESLPTEIVGSGMYKVTDSTAVYGQYKARKSSGLASAGIKFVPREFASLEFNGGYRQYFVLDKVKGGLSLGVSLDLMGIRASYGYEKIEDHPQYDNKSYFSVSLSL